jgi:ribose/xylose/arabinose/galactoside ABC-type transport system permease subunit
MVALGLGATMLIREFDLSVAGVVGLAGCVAVLTGNTYPWLGVGLAVATGLAFGFAQGVIITAFGLGSVAVTLGGLLTASGLAYVLTENRTLSFDDIDVAMALSARVADVLSIRSLVAIGVFAVAAFVFFATRLGRDLVATGSDRRAAVVAGVPVRAIVLGTFALSGGLAGLSGVLVSYGLASASPSGLADVLVPSVAAVILGGVSLSGGTGTPLGVAAGVLTLTALRSGLNAIGAPPYAHGIATGSILFAVATIDAPYLHRRLSALWLRLQPNRT